MAISANKKRPRILVAEDDQMTRMLLQSVLDLAGFDTEVAPTGTDAVTMWEQGVFDLITMDIQMPRMDGITATRLIREKEKKSGNHIPIVAMSAHVGEDQERGYAAGVDAYLPKPLDLDHGVATIKSLIAK